MNMTLHTFYQTFVYLQESVSSSLNRQEKSVLTVIGYSLGMMATLYSVCWVSQKFFAPVVQIGRRRDDGIYGHRLFGQGKQIYRDGKEEAGILKEGRLHGRGKRIYKDKTLEEGTFDNGVLTRGVISYPSGLLKKGEFNKWSGNLLRGKMITPDRTVYEGQFWQDKLHGQGTITYTNGRIQEGIFEFGVLNPSQ